MGSRMNQAKLFDMIALDTRRNRVFALLALFSVLPCAGQAVTASELQITIATSIREMPTASNIPVRITYRNLTEHPMDIPIAQKNFRDITDILQVRGPDGSIIPPYYGTDTPGTKAVWTVMHLNAGESRTFGNTLYASEYGFTKPGLYTAQLKRGPDLPKVPEIDSNSLSVQVVDWDTYIHQETAVPQMRITISTDTSEIDLGGSAEIHAKFANITMTGYKIGWSDLILGNLDVMNQFDVRGPDGKVIPPYQGPHPELGASGPPNTLQYLSPGQILDLEMLFTCKMYRCNKPGDYQVRVCRGRYQTDAPSVCSNTLVFKVIPTESETHP